MAFVVKDRVRVSTASAGTGAVTLGAAVQNAAKGYYRTFAAAGVANGDTVPYLIEDGANWETGIGTYASSGAVLTRTTIVNNSAGTTAPISLSGAAEVAIGLTEAAFAAKADAAAVRETLTSNRTYYVRTDGSDSNNGLANTAGGAFLTIQKALDVVATLDLGGFTVTIQVADGTYTSPSIIPVTVGQSATANLVIQGNSATPANVIVSVASADCFGTGTGARALIKDMELRTTTSGYCLKANGGGAELQWSNVRFGACAASHVLAQALSAAICAGNYAISGAAQQHLQASHGGAVEVGNKTITITGTPAFGTAFAVATQGILRAFGNTYSGSATGVRYQAMMNGSIQTFGAGATALPGNAAGTTATGGQYA